MFCSPATPISSMKTEYLVNAAIIHIFILIMDEMTTCNVEEVARRGDSIENYLPSDSAVEFYRAFYCLPAQLVLVLLPATVWSALLNNFYIYSRQFSMKKILLLMLLHVILLILGMGNTDLTIQILIQISIRNLIPILILIICFIQRSLYMIHSLIYITILFFLKSWQKLFFVMAVGSIF